MGQDEARRILHHALLNNRLAHAYLFLGPSGSGRRHLAIELARVLNCARGVEIASINDCACNSCTSMRQWRHVNLHTILPLPATEKGKKEKVEASDKALAEMLTVLGKDSFAQLRYTGTGEILIEYIRDLRNRLSLAPDLAGTRVIIIYPAENLNDEAANALLKLLEEPPEACIFILIAESSRDLLPTILSRCQQIRFQPLNRDLIETALVSRKQASEVEAKKIAALSQGSYTRAVQLAQGEAGKIAEESLEFLRAAVSGNAGKIAEVIQLWTPSANSKTSLHESLDFLKMWLLDSIAASAGEDTLQATARIIGGTDTALKIGKYGHARLSRALEEVEEAKLSLESNALPALALTVLALKLKRAFQ
jgi:DNA polymerase-3 subunit delta'